MKLELEEAKKKAAATYNSASDFYDHPANTRYARETVERLALTAQCLLWQWGCRKRSGHKKHKVIFLLLVPFAAS